MPVAWDQRGSWLNVSYKWVPWGQAGKSQGRLDLCLISAPAPSLLLLLCSCIVAPHTHLFFPLKTFSES